MQKLQNMAPCPEDSVKKFVFSAHTSPQFLANCRPSVPIPNFTEPHLCLSHTPASPLLLS